MKLSTIITSLLVVISSSIFAQTYAPLPYATSFESGSLDASWTTVVQGAGGNLAQVQVTTSNGPYHLANHLTLDKNSSNTNVRTAEAWLHLDLSGQTEVTLSFYFKDLGDEDNTGADGDGIFFYDSATSAFIEVFHIDPTTYTDNVWQKISLDVDVLAAANSIALTDSFIVKFQQRDNNTINIADLGGVSDGHAYDSVYVHVGGALTAGKISGNDTLCAGATSIAISNVNLPTEGDNTYTYSWQYSTDYVTWNTIVAPSLPNLTFNNPPSGFFWIRRGVSSPSTAEGPVYTTPSFILVTSPVEVNFFGLSANYCNNEAITTLSGSPSGGVFSGSTGLSGNNFDPSTASSSASGTVNNITYTYTDSYGCIYDSTHSTTVKDAPNVTFNDNLGTYVDTDNSRYSMSATPAGGTFSGPGVVNIDEFVPSLSGGIGTKIIEYTYTAVNGCSDAESIDAEVVPNSGGSFGGVVSPVCQDGSNMNITTSIPFGYTAYNDGFCYNSGWYVGTCGGSAAFTVNSSTSLTFSPSVAGPGTYYVYHYSYQTVFPYGYQYNFTSITVQGKPTATINNLAGSYCVDASNASLSVTLSDGSSVSSSTWSGPGMSGNLFVPSNAGVGGPYNINVSASNGVCSANATAQTTVNALPTLSISGFDASYCTNSPLDTILGTPLGGTFTASSGIYYTNLDTLVYNPSALTAGTKSITYTYTDGNGCTKSNIYNTTIFTKPNLAINGFAQSLYCEDASAVNISGFENGNPAPLGTFGGPAVGFTDNGNGTAVFTPTALPVDSIYEIHFTYIDGNGCFDTVFKQITVASLPPVSFSGLNLQYCVSDPIDNLNGNEPTGIFSGSGVSGSTFDPSVGAGIQNVTFTYTDGNGCTNDTTEQTTVFGLPAVSFAGLDAEYCKDAVVDTLVGNQAGGYFTGSEVGTVYNDSSYLDVTNNSFLPQTPYNVIFSYTDINGCFNADTQSFVVHPLPIPNFAGLLSSYCEDDGISGLLGNVNASHPYGYGNSFFFGQYMPNDISNTGVNQGQFNPTQVPIPSAGGVAADTVSFVYIDAKGCRDTIRKATVVHGLPVIGVSFPDNTLCTHDNPVLLSVTKPGVGTENYYLQSSGATIVGGLFDPGSNNNVIGLNNVIFEYQDQYSCINYDTTSVTVYPPPVVGFYLGSFCNNDSISFFDSSVIAPFDFGVNDDLITDWYWTFGDGGDDTLQNPKHQYIVPTTYNIQLTATTREGCTASLIQSELVGEPPVADFSWDNVCFGETLQFTDLSTAQAVDPITTWSWNFDDGNGLDNSVGGYLGTDNVVPVDQNGGITNGTYKDPTHQYQALNSYNVRLILATGSGCVDTLAQVLHVRPVIDTYPYEENFEASNGGWFAGGSTNAQPDVYSWEIGVANGNIISESIANTSWVTNLSGDHNNNEQSYVDGPCFDFTNLTRPMIKMDIWADMLEGSDGAVLQYSLNNGVTWNVIGEIGDGINWYNKTSISGNPGNQAINQVGWSYQDSVWVEARHDLDVLIGEPQVRMRIAFGSDANSANEGLAFDNIWIGERSRITLLEYFTNSSDASSVQDDDDIDNLVFDNRKDVVDIQYHTEFPGNDEMNNHNPADPSARALFYGAFNVGRAALNGNTYNGVSSGITDNHIKLQMLKDSPYSLVVGAENDGTELTATAYLTAREDIDNANVTVHIAVVENQITAITGANADTEFRSVLKKMLPSATGTLVKKDLIAGQEEGIAQSWVMENVFDINRINVVAFVQDNVTNEVYQVTTTDTSAVPPVIVPPLSEEELLTTDQPIKFKLLPNPAHQHVTVLFNQGVRQSDITFMDNFGRVMDHFHVADAMEYITFDLSYPAGVYYVRVVTDNQVVTQKLIVEN